VLQEGTKPLKRRRRKTGQQAVSNPNRTFAVGTAQRTVQRYPMERFLETCLTQYNCTVFVLHLILIGSLLKPKSVAFANHRLTAVQAGAGPDLLIIHSLLADRTAGCRG
jgi:hypothetical protein